MLPGPSGLDSFSNIVMFRVLHELHLVLAEYTQISPHYIGTLAPRAQLKNRRALFTERRLQSQGQCIPSLRTCTANAQCKRTHLKNRRALFTERAWILQCWVFKPITIRRHWYIGAQGTAHSQRGFAAGFLSNTAPGVQRHFLHMIALAGCNMCTLCCACPSPSVAAE